MIKKNKTIIIISVIVFLLIARVTIYLGIGKNFVNDVNIKENNNNNNKDPESNDDVSTNKEDENIINIEINPFWSSEPNLTFLTESAELIVTGKIKRDSLTTTVENNYIYTEMELQINKVVKNNDLASNITAADKTVKIKFLGGRLSAKDYINSLSSNRKEKYDLTSQELENSSFSLDTSNGKLNITEENAEYMFFLNKVDGEWSPNSMHYGIRKIKEKSLYDYDSDSYIATDLLS